MESRKLFLLNSRSKKESNRLFKKQRKDKKDYDPFIFMSKKDQYLFYDIKKIGYLDIETEGLVADFGVMFSYAILIRDVKTNKTEIRYGVVNRKDLDLAQRKDDYDLFDKRITEKLMKDIAECDLLIGHWFIGKHRHDVPFIRTRCAINKVPGFPKYKMVRYGDTQKWSSLIHRLHSNGLASIADAYGISTKKTEIKTKMWKNARMASPKALKYILLHNIKDVIITHKVHRRIEDYVGIPSTYA